MTLAANPAQGEFARLWHPWIKEIIYGSRSAKASNHPRLFAAEGATSAWPESIATWKTALSIDTIGEPVTPESVRDVAAENLAAAARNLDVAQGAVNRAWQL